MQEALQLVFAKFAEFQSARQVHIWLRDEGIELPVKSRNVEARGIIWRLPAYNIVHNILTNPIYAGAYAFGRTTSRVSVENGRKRVRRGVHRPMAEWDVLIKDHHEAYITWDEFEKNLRVIANNATGMSSATVRGAVRRGELLLPGLLRCGHCGRKLHVHYSGKLGRYNCYGARVNHGTARCISISGLSIDAAISKEVLGVLKPLGIDAAVKAIEAQTSQTTAAQRQLALSRDATWSMVIAGIDSNPQQAGALMRWGRAYWDAVHKFNPGGAYVNFMMDDEGEARVQASYGENFTRLAAIKKKYDPANLFRVNQNIKPAA